jgi:hypothetical protein
MDTPEQQTALEIFSAEPKAEAGKQCISFRRKKVSEADSYRAVLVPSYTGLDCVAYGDGSNEQQETEVQNIFTAALHSVFLDAASTILRRYCDEKKDAKNIPADFLSFSAVVSEMAQQQTSQRLNGDAIGAWYDASETCKAATERYGNEEKGKKQQAALREKFLSLASNNPAIPVPLATKMLAYVSTEDAEHPICRAVCKRLEKLMASTPDADEL